MNKKQIGLACRALTIFAALTVGNLQAQTLVVTGDDGKSLYEVDVTTAVAQRIGAGNTNTDAWGGTLDRNGNFFLPIANGKDLGQLNRTTGQEILIAASNFSGTDLFAMEIDTRTGTLYAVDYTSRQFFTVNLTTGTATPFGNLSFLQPIGGRFFNDLAFAPDGTLWAAIGKAVQGVGSGDLYTIDLQTGQANWETVPET